MMSAPYRRWTNIERNLTPDFLPRGAGIVRHEVEHGLIGKRHETIMLLVHICFSNLAKYRFTYFETIKEIQSMIQGGSMSHLFENSSRHGCLAFVAACDLNRDANVRIEGGEHLHQPVKRESPQVRAANP